MSHAAHYCPVAHHVFHTFLYPKHPVSEPKRGIAPPPPIPSGCGLFTGAWTVTRASPSRAASGRCVLTAAAACARRCGGRFTVFAAHCPPHSGRPPHVSPRFRVREAQLLQPSACCPGRPPLKHKFHWGNLPDLPPTHTNTPFKPRPASSFGVRPLWGEGGGFETVARGGQPLGTPPRGWGKVL